MMKLIATAPLLYFLRPRTRPISSTTPQRLSLSFLTLPSFWILQTGNILQSLGYFVPSTYLASYASIIGLKPQTGTLMIALLNATSVPGSLLIGILNDRCHVTNVILISTIGSTLAVLVFWAWPIRLLFWLSSPSSTASSLAASAPRGPAYSSK